MTNIELNIKLTFHVKKNYKIVPSWIIYERNVLLRIIKIDENFTKLFILK